MLAELVKAGKLPSVDKRLPENPYVVPHKWLTPGKYGGTFQTSSAGSDDSSMGNLIAESMYGHSPLRWLLDGQEIGPGLVESWESNADTSQWTFHFRKGLKWSDGQPWTVDDITFWWNDMVLNQEANEAPPDEGRSGKNTLMQMKKIDDNTLQFIYDAPAPLTADRLAMWVNGVIGPRWMVPKHYAQQFHPKYNPSAKGTNGKSWGETLKDKVDYTRNPDCPVMTGWKIQKYTQGQRGEWERNPYYWCVDKDGNQLPFMDRWVASHYQDAQVQKLGMLDGKVDFVNGEFASLALSDVAAFKQAQPKSKLEVRFWDDGGIPLTFFFNYDYQDEKWRKLIRMPEFRKALSHAQNREDARKSIFYNQGELTTGTMSTKAIEYRINEQGKQVYAEWRDSAVKYDPELAKSLFDKIGVKVGPNGMRTMPDGSPLSIRLDHHADASKDAIAHNQLLVRDWKAVGIDAKLNPVPPAGWDDQWRAGQLMSNTDWGVGDGPNHLVYPQWLVPLENSRWAPLEGQYYDVRGTPKENTEQNVDPYKRKPPRMAPDPGGPVDRLWKLYDQSKVEPDFMKRTKLVWDMIKIHVTDGPFYQGTVANPPAIILVGQDLKNAPKREDLALGGFVGPWIHPTPAVYDPESWYFDNPDAHNV